MFLAFCIAECEDELTCDLAETYSIYDYEGLPPNKVAAFCFGLKNDSRVKMFVSKQKIPMNQLLLARIADELAFIAWSKTVDGQKNRNRPKSILESLLHTEQEKEVDYTSYATGAEFMAAWRKIMEDKQNG